MWARKKDEGEGREGKKRRVEQVVDATLESMELAKGTVKKRHCFHANRIKEIS